ncbi:NACHT domain-containing protein [Amycolatopsis sp. NPDC058278]|uniref:NACHT and WD40 repeat domain-containing protein n=1 Tax=Amycolatopsis sp. NPDC058278 TaxID=3346417 RepID=UPI0036DF568A
MVGVALALVGNLATNTVQVTGGGVLFVWIATGLLVVAAIVLQGGPLLERVAGSTTPEGALRALRETVEIQWRTEAVRSRSLSDPAPMPVRWNLTAAVELSGQVGEVVLGGSVNWSGTAEDIAGLAAEFRGLATRRLVIAGGAGAGKTTLAIQLVRELVATWESGDPVPVMLSVSDWDITKHTTFESWLTVRLAEAYPALREPTPYPARRLFTLGHILPVLDGLDELPEEVRPRILRLVNEALDKRTQLVLTSRTREYAEAAGAGQLITRAAVISAEPMSADAAAGYLAEVIGRSLPHSGWQLLLDGLRANPSSPLAEVLSRPLGLWLLRTAYEPTADPSGLLDNARFAGTAALHARLFDRLIPELIRVRPPASGEDATQYRPLHAWDPVHVERWLGHLANVMRQSPGERRQGQLSTGSRDFAWWRLPTMVLPHPLPAPALLLVVALVGTGWLTLVGHTAFHLRTLDSAALAVLLLFLLREGKYTGYWTDHAPAPAVRGLSRRFGFLPGLFVRSLPFGAFCCAVMWFLYTAAELLFTDLTTAFHDGLRLGVLTGIVLVLGRLNDRLSQWVVAPTGEAAAGTPYSNWHADRATHVVRLLLGGLLAATVGAVVIAVAGAAAHLVALGAALGLAAGAGYALVTGHNNAWPAYLAATVHLARQGRTPRRLMSFLEDAHRLGLLRAVGPIYQFRHADFQDHLAARHAPPPPTSPVPTPIARHSHRRSHKDFSATFVRAFRVPRRLLDVAFSPDGTTVALFRDGATDLVDLTGRRVRRVRHGLAPLRMLVPSGAVTFSPDGRHCAVTGSTIRLWPLGRMVGHARIFEVATGRETLRLRHSWWIKTLAYSPDGTRIATGGGDLLQIWDTATGRQIINIHHTGEIGSVAFSPDSQRLATGTYLLGDNADDATTEVWDAATGKALLRLRIHPVRFHNITSVTFSPGGAFIASANGWAITVWDALTGTQVLTLPTGAGHVVFSPDGLHLLTSGGGPHTDLRKSSDGTSDLRITHRDWVTRALFSPDGSLLLSVGEDRNAQLWQLWE